MKKLTPEALQAIRDHETKPEQHHHILLRQNDCRALLDHIDALEAELAAALSEQDRLRRSIP